MCSALSQNQEAERMVVCCKTLGMKISQTNRGDYDSTGIKCLQAQSNAYNERVQKAQYATGKYRLSVDSADELVLDDGAR